jgi:hypothetical protein
LSSNRDRDELQDIIAEVLAIIVIKVVIALLVLTFEAIGTWFNERVNQIRTEDLAFTLTKRTTTKGMTPRRRPPLHPLRPMG